VFFESGFDALPVGVAETPDAAKDDAFVEGEELEANETLKRKACAVVIVEDTIPRPRVVASGCDHCQYGMAGRVEGLVAEHQRGPPFFGCLL
jgi:hypothetical protein